MNQVGYLRYATKIGVIVDDSTVSREFQVQDSTGSVLLTGTTSVYGADGASEDNVHQADFTGLETLGAYRLVVGGIGSSLEFSIAPNLYPGKSALVLFCYVNSCVQCEVSNAVLYLQSRA